jgi:hypothetical protein
MSTQQLDLIVGLCRLEEIPYEIEQDIATLMKLTKGRMNPTAACGVWFFPNNRLRRVLITNVYQAVDFIREHGLVKL